MLALYIPSSLWTLFMGCILLFVVIHYFFDNSLIKCARHGVFREQLMQIDSFALRGPFAQNMTKFSKNLFVLLLMKYQHVTDVAVKINSCATCVKGVRRG